MAKQAPAKAQAVKKAVQVISKSKPVFAKKAPGKVRFLSSSDVNSAKANLQRKNKEKVGAADKAKKGNAKDKLKIAKKPKNLQERYEFVAKNLKNHDDYFRLNFSIDFLIDIFNTLMEEEKVSKSDIEKFVQGTYQNKSLLDIFNHFNIKQN